MASALVAQLRDQREAVALGQHAVDDQHVVVAVERERQTRLAVAGELGHVAGLAQRLLQIVGGFAVVLDDKQAHGGIRNQRFDGRIFAHLVPIGDPLKRRAGGFWPPAPGIRRSEGAWGECRRLHPTQPRADRDGHEAGALLGFHAHEHHALASGAGCGDCIADIGRRRDGLARNFEDHVAGLEAALGGGAFRLRRR